MTLHLPYIISKIRTTLANQKGCVAQLQHTLFLFFGERFLLPGFLAALGALHMAGSAHMRSHSCRFIGGNIFISALMAHIEAGHLLDAQDIEATAQEQHEAQCDQRDPQLGLHSHEGGGEDWCEQHYGGGNADERFRCQQPLIGQLLLLC